MKVAIVGKANRQGGGASRTSELLEEGLRGEGHDVTRFVVHPVSGPGSHRSLFGPRLANAVRLIQVGSRRGLGGEFLPLEWPAIRRITEGFDLVHINDHWQAISPWAMRWLAARVPTVLTLHDASFFTGGCLYPMACERHQESCGACPYRRAMRMPLDVTDISLAVKKWALQRSALTLIAPSRWMAEMSRRSALARDMEVWVIGNGIQTLPFVSADPIRARARFGLDAGEFVVAVGSSSFADRRKGAELALATLNAIEGVPVKVLLFGHGSAVFASRLRHTAVRVGYVNDDEVLADVYAAANLFLFPSLADNAPLSVIECLCTGTPVVALDRGGTPELIESGSTGWIAGTARGLVEAVRRTILERASWAGRRDQISERAARAFNLRDYTERHLALYAEVIARRQETNPRGPCH